MATLLLSGLGNSIGGEFGALAGAMVGRSIDSGMFGRTRARIKEDLSVQTASYGRQIPKIFGTMRVGGAIVWATDLQARPIATNGKLGPSGTGYSANFAVALSSRAARRVGRIWADGKLLRGAAGDFKVPTKFRFYAGDEDQIADPLIVSVEGLGAAPAFRGLALAVFEEFQLAAFGNRIPYLTFEVEADNEPPSVAAIVGEVCGEYVPSSSSTSNPKGFAAVGDDVGTALAALAEAYGIESLGAGVRRGSASRTFVVADEELGCSTGEHVGAEDVRRRSSSKLSSRLRIGYFDADMELQASEQKIGDLKQGGLETHFELPVVLTAGHAKTLGQAILSRRWLERERRTVRLPQSYMSLRPGDRLVLPQVGNVVVDRVLIEELVVIADCRREAENGPDLAASSGRNLPSADVRPPSSEVFLLDLPAFDSAPASPTLAIAARGGADPWRTLPVTLTPTGHDSDLISIENRALAGMANTVLAEGSIELIDRANSVIVEMRDGDWLENCSRDDLVGGANLALLGDEIIQFSVVDALSARKFAISHLLRGRFGTEWACSQHAVGDRFILLKPAYLKRFDMRMGQVGSQISAVGRGVGDQLDVTLTTIDYRAESLRPPSPVHLSATRSINGSLTLTWVRRSRCGYHWFDRVDAPLAEEQERYIVTIVGPFGQHEVFATEPRCVADLTTLQALGSGVVTAEVVQLGRELPSRPASLQVRI